MKISDKIKEIRKEHSLSQTEFGEKIGVSRDVIKNIELDLNKKGIPYNIIKLICCTFGINEDWLLYGTGEKYIQDKDSIVDDLANKYNLSLCGKQILKTYLELSDDKKAVIDEFIEQLLDNYNEIKTSDDDYVTFVAADGIINKTLKIKKSDIGIDKDNFK